MVIPFEPVRYELLADAVDDWYGLYEIIWGLRVLYPHADDAERRAVGEAALRDLVAKGWACLLAATYTNDGSKRRPLSPAETEAALGDDASWADPVVDEAEGAVEESRDTGPERVEFTATDAGMAAYKAGRITRYGNGQDAVPLRPSRIDARGAPKDDQR
jgi:hypothetical protein